MANQTLPSPQRSEAANQYLRCVGRIRAAEKSGQNPAPDIAQARQWLAVVRLANPREAETLELELNRAAAHRSVTVEDNPGAWDSRLYLLRLAWIGVPFAFLFMIAGGDIVVQVLAGVCFIGLLALIFLN